MVDYPAETHFCSAACLSSLPKDLSISERSIPGIFRAGWCTVQVARNGQQGFEMLDAKPTAYDLVLLDIVMPDVDGIEVRVLTCFHG